MTVTFEPSTYKRFIPKAEGNQAQISGKRRGIKRVGLKCGAATADDWAMQGSKQRTKGCLLRAIIGSGEG
jgi:hypothetical protein